MVTFTEPNKQQAAMPITKGGNYMVLKMFSVRDSKGEKFHPPFFKSTHGEAERDFAQMVRDEKSLANKFPEDFDLYYIGLYDDLTGKMETLDTPQHLQKAITFTSTQ